MSIEIERIVSEISAEYNAISNEQLAEIIREFEMILVDANSILWDYAEEDGTIRRTRTNSIAREFDAVERKLRERGVEIFEKSIGDSAEWTTGKVAAVLGITLTAAFLLNTRTEVIDVVMNKKGPDGLHLSERIWSVAAQIRNGIVGIIRDSIIRGKGVSEIIPEVRAAFDRETWKIERLVRTELMVTYREAILENARKSDVVKWVQFHDGTCGRRDHHTHKCFELVNEDRHGKGPGVFKVTDVDIIAPHPQCTSYFTYIVEGDDD